MAHSTQRSFFGIPARIFATMAATGLAAVGAVCAVALWMSSVTNVVEEGQSRALFEGLVAARTQALTVNIEDYGYWEDAYEMVLAGDEDALLDNVGVGAIDNPTFDFLYIVSPDGSPLYAYEMDGEASDLSIVHTEIVREFMPLIQQTDILPYATVTGFADVGGRITSVAIGRMIPYDEARQIIGSLPFLIGGFHMEDDRLTAMGEQVLIKEVEVFADAVDVPDDWVGIPLSGPTGETVATLAWQPTLPGTALMWRSLPIIAGLSLVLIVGNLAIGRSIASQAARFVSADRQARTDALTGTLNRAGLSHLVNTPAIDRALTEGRLAVIYLDLNDFKILNDTAGHEAGDLALQITSERLRSAIRRTDYLARIGGDEFVCLLIDDNPIQTAEYVAERIQNRTGNPIHIGDIRHDAKPSIGIAISDRQTPWETLLSRADSAMYQAKNGKFTGPVFFRMSQKNLQSVA